MEGRSTYWGGVEFLRTRFENGDQHSVPIYIYSMAANAKLWSIHQPFEEISFKEICQRIMGQVQEIIDKSSSQFRLSDFIDPVSLLGKLKNEKDPLSQYLRSKLTPPTVALISQYLPTTQPQKEFVNALVDDFNRLLKEPILYQDEAFAGIKLRPRTKQLLERALKGEDVRLNRMLIEDAYPAEIAKGQIVVFSKGYLSADDELIGDEFDKLLDQVSLDLNLTSPS
jgi:hypothetical protein